MGICFRLLGPAEIAVGEETVALPSNKPCVVLATLLLNANKVVPLERLQLAVWGASPPDTARATMQTYVLRLRRLLAKYFVSACPIRTVPRGYMIEATSDTLDVLRFRELARLGRQHAEAGDLVAESQCLVEALTLWRGAAMSNVDSDLLHAEDVPVLDEERLEVVDRRISVVLALGKQGGLVAELRTLTAAYPQRERFAEHLIEALYRSGRQSEALAEARRVREVLRQELGIDPGRRLQELELAILRGDPPPPDQPVPAVVAVPAAVPRGRQVESSGQLPAGTDALVGRQDLTARVARDLTGLAEPAIVSISGAPGVGKTALAVHIAHRVRDEFPDGQWYLRLTSPGGTARDPAVVLAELLRLLGVDTGALPAQTAVLSAAYRARLSERRVLVLLDDVDSLAQVAPLLPGAAGSAALLTSRRSLLGLTALLGIRCHLLDMLDRADSLELLALLLGRSRLDAEPSAALEIAELCGGLPLALRIAATKARHWHHGDLADFVGWLRTDTLSKLSVGADPSVSVRQAFDSSYRRLSEQARRVLRVAGADATGQVTADQVARRLRIVERQAEAALDELFDACLLTARGPGWFGVPGLVRAYAREREWTQ